jgi:hypothetical protein
MRYRCCGSAVQESEQQLDELRQQHREAEKALSRQVAALEDNVKSLQEKMRLEELRSGGPVLSRCVQRGAVAVVFPLSSWCDRCRVDCRNTRVSSPPSRLLVSLVRAASGAGDDPTAVINKHVSNVYAMCGFDPGANPTTLTQLAQVEVRRVLLASRNGRCCGSGADAPVTRVRVCACVACGLWLVACGLLQSKLEDLRVSLVRLTQVDEEYVDTKEREMEKKRRDVLRLQRLEAQKESYAQRLLVRLLRVRSPSAVAVCSTQAAWSLLSLFRCCCCCCCYCCCCCCCCCGGGGGCCDCCGGVARSCRCLRRGRRPL